MLMKFRQGSNACNSFSSTHRSRCVILSISEGSHHGPRDPSLMLRMTPSDRSNRQELFFITEPCLKKNEGISSSVGADLSCTSPIYRPSLACSDTSLHVLIFMIGRTIEKE